jgi:hypothetical protein
MKRRHPDLLVTIEPNSLGSTRVQTTSFHTTCLNQNLAKMNFDGSIIYAIHLHYVYDGAQYI